MGDSTPLLPQMAAAADDREIVFNGTADPLSPSSLYGRDYRNCTGLTWAYFGGRFGSTAIANGTLSATASNTNYVVANRSTGAVSIATTITNWNDTTTYLRLYLLVVGASSVTSYEDHRQAIAGAVGAGGTDTEAVQDIVGAMVVAGNGTYITYGDVGATLTIGVLSEFIEDRVGALLTAGTGITLNYDDAGSPPSLSITASASAPPKVIQIACSDETTALTAGNNKVIFRMPYAMTLTAGSGGVRGSLSTAQATDGGGGIFTVDINESGSTILSTKLTIDNTEKTSTTAATAVGISDTTLADDAEITIDIDQIGDGTAKGLKISLIGT